MPFTNAIVGGGNQLVRTAIQSPNYVPGSTGWRIAKDGSAEFGSGSIVRGSLFVTDPDGSYVHIYDQNPGTGATIDIRPADSVGHTLGPGEINAFKSGTRVTTQIVSPQIDGGSQSSIEVNSAQTGVLTDDQIRLLCQQLVITAGQGASIFGDVTILNSHNLDVNGSIKSNGGLYLGNSYALNSDVGPAVTESTTSATYSTVRDSGGTFAFVTQYDKHDTSTRLLCMLSTTLWTDTSGTTVQWGLKDVGTGTIVDLKPQLLNDSAFVHQTYVGMGIVSGIPAGAARQMAPVWKRSAGAGGLSRNNTANIYLTVQEIHQ